MATIKNTDDTYARMRPGKGFLAGIDAGGGDEAVEPKDIKDGEAWAKQEIDEYLQITFDNSDLSQIPRTIEIIARKLAAKWILDIAERNSDTHAGVRWEKEARMMLKELRDGQRGLKMRDNTWHHRFPGNWNAEEGREGGLQIISG